jgi:hypothetical protein
MYALHDRNSTARTYLGCHDLAPTLYRYVGRFQNLPLTLKYRANDAAYIDYVDALLRTRNLRSQDPEPVLSDLTQAVIEEYKPTEEERLVSRAEEHTPSAAWRSMAHVEALTAMSCPGPRARPS